MKILIRQQAGAQWTMVECKLAANAEIKRRVIGQALEYGAYLWGMAYEELDDRVQARRGIATNRLAPAV